ASRVLTCNRHLLVNVPRGIQNNRSYGWCGRSRGWRDGRGNDRRHITGPRPRSVRVDPEHSTKIVTGQSRVVGLHAPEIPEFTPYFVQALRRTPFEHEAYRP